MKRILLVTDVYGWGGHIRAEYIKKHLSDEFDFDIMDGEEFNKFNKSKGGYSVIMKYDLIYLLFHTQLLRKDVARIFQKPNRPKFITCVTSSTILRAGFTTGIRNIEEAKTRFHIRANNCSAILANNNESFVNLKELYSGKIFYAPRGVDEKVFYPTRKFIEKPENEFTAGYVGKPTEEKGLHIIELACKKAGVKLIKNTRNYTNALSQDQMRDFYNKMDVYVVASSADGTPNPALESAACGIPLVANHIGNMPELIENHKNGWLVEKRSVINYINRLNWLKKNQKVAWEFGQKIRETILKDWTWEKVLNKNERMSFREILK